MGQKGFAAPIILPTELGPGSYRIFERSDAQKSCITVLGGSKSAYDAVYLFASRGFPVNWIIRKSGYGPSIDLHQSYERLWY